MDPQNPYRTAESIAASEPSSSARRIPWATTPARCFVGAILFWPVVATITDLIGMYPEQWFAIDDFGLTVSNVTMPVCWLIAIALWFRAFLLSADRPRTTSAMLALITLPIWFIPTAIIMLLMFPFGRVSDTF